MDRETAEVYETRAADWIAQRRPRAIEEGTLDAFASALPPGARVADLGCGPGWYAAHLRDLGHRAVGLDLSRAMLGAARERCAGVGLVRADLATLPCARGSLDGAFAAACYQHLPRTELPAALAQLHDALAVGAPVLLYLVALEGEEQRKVRSLVFEDQEAQVHYEDDPFGARLFCKHTAARAAALLEGAGFEGIEIERKGYWLLCRARGARSLSDTVTDDLRVLFCGLNPSLHAADRGVAFARPGNRFWPALLEAGLVVQDRDPWDALRRGIGLTDLVKRATARADELEPAEYARGVERLEALVRLHRPAVTCFVGLAGFRRVIDRSAQPGWVEGGFAGRPAYLMPSTSGANANHSQAALTEHVRRAVL